MRTLRFFFTSILLLTASLNSIAQNKGTIEGEALDALNLSPLHNWTIEAVQGSSAIAVLVRWGAIILEFQVYRADSQYR